MTYTVIDRYTLDEVARQVQTPVGGDASVNRLDHLVVREFVLRNRGVGTADVNKLRFTVQADHLS